MIQLKTEKQIDGIRVSCQMLREVMDILFDSIETGMTTRDIDQLAHTLIKERGGRPAFYGYMDFPGAVCSSVNEVVIHGIPDDRKLKSGDLVGIDCGIEYNGYYSDMAFTKGLGTINADSRKLLQATEECLYKGIEAAVAGKRISDISKAVFEHADAHNLGVVRDYCGHGVGFSVHEDPQVPNYISRGPNPRIKSGMVLALEPMMTLGTGSVDVLEDEWSVVPLDKSLTAHFEHTIAIFEDRTEILTSGKRLFSK